MQGKAALCEVDAAFKKLHEDLDQRKAKVIEEVKSATQPEIDGRLLDPNGVAVDQEGNYFVSGHDCIQVFDSVGKF